MNAHHLKHTPNPEKERMKTHLHALTTRSLGLEPYIPLKDQESVESSKSGRFSQSNCAIALYSNAYSEKAMFPESEAPHGYIHRSGSDLFSFGVYQRHDGRLFGCILPLRSSLETISSFSNEAMASLPISGVYVRFLRRNEYSRLVSDEFGFKPAKEEPWLPDAPEEDESLCHSRMDLRKTMAPEGRKFIYDPLKRAYTRGRNFLKLTGLEYHLVPLTKHNLTVAMSIVKEHFRMLEEKGTLVGSSHFDYYGLLHPEIISLNSVVAYVGFLGSLPISVFICEPTGEKSIAGYAGITLRNIDYVSMEASHVPLDAADPSFKRGFGEITGASAIPTYAFARLLLAMGPRKFESFFLGGSEHADIDAWKKRQMGAERDPTYWAVLTE